MEKNYQDTEEYQKGIAYFLSKYDPAHKELIDNLYAFSPALADVVVSGGLYEIWTQKTQSLSDQQKEIAVLASLVTHCTVHSEIKAHAICMLNVGLSKEQIKELLVLMTTYIGVPKVIVAAKLIDEAFKEYDAAHPKTSEINTTK